MSSQAWGWWRPASAAAGPAPAELQGDAAVTGGVGATPFRALVLFTCLLLLAPQSFIPALGALHLPFLTALLAGGSYVMGQFSRHRRLFSPSPAMLYVFLLVAWAVATAPLSLWPGGSVHFFLGVYFKALVVFWLLTVVVDRTGRLSALAWTLSVLAVPLAGAAVKHYLAGGYQAEAESHGLDRIAGYSSALTANPNDLALMLNLIVPLSIALFLATRNVVLRGVLVACIGLDVIAIIASFSRAGFLTLGVTGFLYFVIFLRRRRRGLAALMLAAALAGAAMVPSSYLERLSTITNIQADQTNSAQTRLRDTLTAAKYVAQHPLIGAGIGMNILALNEARGATWTLVHNVYLEYGVDLGLPGLILFLLLLHAVMKNLKRARRALADRADQLQLHCLVEGLSVSLVGFIVSAFFYPDAYQFYFYYIAGLAIAATSIALATAGPVRKTMPQAATA